jgi:hypothetical protein
MASCTTTIQNLIASGQILNQTQIYPNTLTSISLTQTAPQILLLESKSTQTITFNISGASSAGAGSPVNLLLTIYSYIGGVVTSVGSVNLTNANSSFQKDFGSGYYIFCIASQNTAGFKGTLIGSFVGFPTVASMITTAYFGSSMAFTLYQKPPAPAVCSQPIWFEVVDGKLPPGIELIQNGILEGVFPNLDCVDDEDPYSPAVNWFYEQGGSTLPVGRQWRFQVKIYLENFPDVTAYQWFCIRIYNDWSLDRNNFAAQPKTKTVTIAKVNLPTPIPVICEPCDTITPLPVFAPVDPLCPECAVPEGTIITAESVILPVAAEVILNQRGANDLDTLFLEWGTIVNQENPLFTEPMHGEYMEVSIDFHTAS